MESQSQNPEFRNNHPYERHSTFTDRTAKKIQAKPYHNIITKQ